MSTSTLMVDGNWRRVSASTDIDLEAGTITGTRAPFELPTVPEPARAASSPTRTPHDTITDVVGGFFGATCPHATREGQHDHCSEVLPPPYPDPELPAYSVAPNTEPDTLAMYLFKFGFLFPPLWILGAIILIFPLSHPANFEPSKSETERQKLVQIIRDAELRWAQRCAWALFVVFVLAGMAAAIVLVVLHP